MTFGLQLTGVDGSLIASTFTKNITFRGKATYSSLGIAPSTALAVNTTITINGGAFPNGCPTANVSSVPSGDSTYRITRSYPTARGPVPPQSAVIATGTIQNTIAILLYTIVSPNKPFVFINTASPTTKGGVMSIAQSGTVGGVPNWVIQISASFPLGQSTATTVSLLTLYCFSEILPSESTTGYGLQTYTEDGVLAYTTNVRALSIKDYVTLTASNNPPNIADMIYTRTFCPNPEVSVFSLAKPGFLNVDFSRYIWREYVTSETFPAGWGASCTYYQYIAYFDNKIYNTGVSVLGGDLDFSLSIYDGQFGATLLGGQPGSGIGPPPPALPPNIILSKSESFPITIPIIDCTEYD